MAVSVAYSTINTYTDKFYVRKMIDNFFLKSALWSALEEGKKEFEGGEDIRVPLSYGNNTTAKRWRGRDDVLDTTTTEHATLGVFPIRYTAVSIVLPKTDVLKNMGRARIANMLETQVKLGTDSLVDLHGQDAYKDGSADSNGVLGILGLAAVCTRAADPSSGSYAGITRSGASGGKSAPTGNAFHNSNVIAANANTTVTMWGGDVTMDNSAALTTAKMQEMYGACTDGVDAIFTSQKQYNKYVGLLTQNLRQMTSDKIGKMGFRNTMYVDAPVIPDRQIQNSGDMFFLNFEHLYLMVHPQMDFEPTPFRPSFNQLVDAKFVTWMGQLICDKAHAQGYLTSLS